jgi:poly(A) polymerase
MEIGKHIGHSLRLCAFSAIDRYLGFPELPFVWAETDADPAELAKAFEGLRFPGTGLADAALDAEGQSWYFRCSDADEPYRPSYRLLSFSQDEKTRRFLDSEGVYPILREFRDGLLETASEPWWNGLNRSAESYRAAMDAALILARYAKGQPPVKAIAESFQDLPRGSPPGVEEQRAILTCLLESSRPDLGLELLKLCGFIEELWHELGILDDVDHSKEFHPEGNVWKHTMETFRYRKTFDLRLSLGLLLHDAGKPLAKSSGLRRFDGHAELGAEQSRIFLKRLGFDAALIEDIWFLVKHHMIPAALPRLPLAKTQKVLESPLFPTLLELYRCDESSSFKGLQGYYQSSAAYRAYLRHRRNPYRSADGKKR